MADTAPVAPSPAPAEPSVANQTNSNPAPTASTEGAPVEPQITAEQVAKFFGTTPEAITKSKTFADNNGGYDKVFAERKQAITDPDKKAEVNSQPQQPAQQPQAQPQQPQAQEPPKQPQKLPEGMASLQELMMQQYFQNLSQKKEYANIAEEISNGQFLKDMQTMGMNPVDANNNINVAQVSKYLDMYSKTKPAATPSTPMEGTGSAPTKSYTEVPDGKFTSISQAQEIASQSGHPQHKQALDYIFQQMSGKPQQNNAGQTTA